VGEEGSLDLDALRREDPRFWWRLFYLAGNKQFQKEFLYELKTLIWQNPRPV
jgi:hypothetical protein